MVLVDFYCVQNKQFIVRVDRVQYRTFMVLVDFYCVQNRQFMALVELNHVQNRKFVVLFHVVLCIVYRWSSLIRDFLGQIFFIS